MNGFVPTTRIASPAASGSPAEVWIDSPSMNAAAASVASSLVIGGIAGLRVMKNT